MIAFRGKASDLNFSWQFVEKSSSATLPVLKTMGLRIFNNVCWMKKNQFTINLELKPRDANYAKHVACAFELLQGSSYAINLALNAHDL